MGPATKALGCLIVFVLRQASQAKEILVASILIVTAHGHAKRVLSLGVSCLLVKRQPSQIMLVGRGAVKRFRELGWHGKTARAERGAVGRSLQPLLGCSQFGFGQRQSFFKSS